MLRLAPQGRRQSDRIRMQERIYDGFAYVFHRVIDGVSHVRCRDKTTKICPSRGRIIDGEIILDRPHSHPREENVGEAATFLKLLYEATVGRMKPVSDVHRDMIDRYPEAAGCFDEGYLLGRMSRWRAAVKPPPSSTYSQFANTLNSVNFRVFRVHQHGIMSLSLARSNNGSSTALVFSDKLFIEKLASCSELHIASTTRVLPTNMEDTMEFIVAAAVHQNYVFPLVWEWCRSRDESVFQSLLDPLRNVISPDTVWTNFDSRLHAAVADAFGQTDEVKGSFEFYVSYLVDDGKRLGLDVAGDPHVRTALKKLFGIALLPASKIQEGFAIVKNSERAEYAPMLEPLFTAFEETWIRKVKPQEFSVYNNLRAMSNSASAIIQVVENKLHTDKSPLNFARELLNIQARSYTDLQRVNCNQGVTASPRARYVVPVSQLKRFWRLLSGGKWSTDRFLGVCSNFLEPVLAALIHRNEPLVVNFDPVVGRGTADLEAEFPPLNDNDDFDDEGGYVRQEEREQRPPLRLSPERDAPDNCRAVDWLCIICRINPIQYACMPCLHISFCSECSATCTEQAENRQRELRCPLCRTPATHFSRAWLPSRDYAEL